MDLTFNTHLTKSVSLTFPRSPYSGPPYPGHTVYTQIGLYFIRNYKLSWLGIFQSQN